MLRAAHRLPRPPAHRHCSRDAQQRSSAGRPSGPFCPRLSWPAGLSWKVTALLQLPATPKDLSARPHVTAGPIHGEPGPKSPCPTAQTWAWGSGSHRLLFAAAAPGRLDAKLKGRCTLLLPKACIEGVARLAPHGLPRKPCSQNRRLNNSSPRSRLMHLLTWEGPLTTTDADIFKTFGSAMTSTQRL